MKGRPCVVATMAVFVIYAKMKATFRVWSFDIVGQFTQTSCPLNHWHVFFTGGGEVKRFAIKATAKQWNNGGPLGEVQVAEICCFFQVRGAERNLISVEWGQISKAMPLEICSFQMLSWDNSKSHWRQPSLTLKCCFSKLKRKNGGLLSSTQWISFPFGCEFST